MKDMPHETLTNRGHAQPAPARGAEPAAATSAGGSGNTESPSARRLRERIEALAQDARHMSRILPRAVALSTQGSGLAEAMAPAVERAMAINGRRNSAGMAEALAPVVVPALRKAVLAWMRQGFGALNRVMLKYASITGLRWRLEARKRGIPFEDVFREYTRSLPVKQVFLIHRETGILLQQVQSEIDTSNDWDIVTGMLTAIGDFVHDSFNVGKDDHLESIRLGDLTIVIEQGEYAAIAGVLRGDVPADLRERFRSALGRIHAEFAHELEGFTGETSVFEKSRTFLENCLQALISTDQAHILPQTVLVALIPPLLIVYAAATVGVEQHRWRTYIADVASQPGVLVIQEGTRGGRHYVHGLRDPGAPNPIAVLMRHGLGVDDVDSRWASLPALREPPTLEQIQKVLNPPESIVMELQEGLLVMRGAASQDWIDGALVRLKNFSSLPGYRTDGLVVSDVSDYRRWDNYVQKLENEPGLVVLKTGRRDGRFYVYGLRDPMARDPNAIMGELGIDAAHVDSGWESYQALHPTMVLDRSRQVLDPPTEVTLSLRDGVLVAKGRAPYRWIDRAQALSRSVAGVRAFDSRDLVDADLEEVRALQGQVEAEVFRFLVGAPDLWPGQGSRIEALVANVARLQRVAARREQRVVVEIRGHTDATGDPQRDQAESTDLASTFYESLRWRGLDMSVFDKRGLGAIPPSVTPESAREAKNRLVSFSVKLEDT